MVAEGVALVLLPLEAAALEDRHDLVREAVELVPQVRRLHVEAVRGICPEPLLEPVGHVLGRADCGGRVASTTMVFTAAVNDQPVGLYVDSWSAWQRDESPPVERGTRLTRSNLIDADCS